MSPYLRYVFSPIAFGAFLAAGTLTTLAGPFGTYVSLSFPLRAAYWYGLVGCSLLIALTIRFVVDSTFVSWGFPARSVATGMTFATVFTPVVLAANALVLTPSDIPMLGPVQIFLVILSVPLMINPIIYFIYRLQGLDPNAITTVSPPRPRLLRRLPDELGNDLVRLAVEDHYVHVVTEKGAERLLMRFGDAIEEVDGVPGMQVHRSHWIAIDAVVGHQTDGNRLMLRLSDGATVPVSRNFRADVEAAGLLANVSRRPRRRRGRRSA